MSRHTDPQPSAAVTLPDLQKRAKGTPLTEEARNHLAAAASTADDRFMVMRAMVEAAIEPLREANRHVGSDLTLSDEEVRRIVAAVEGSLDYGHGEVVEPLFSRWRGEAPYVEDIDLSTEEAS